MVVKEPALPRSLAEPPPWRVGGRRVQRGLRRAAWHPSLRIGTSEASAA
ncbi:hypothetical protein [Thermogemmata fonticola]|uniref:Uncharacterized protein n=1 Tax=Thermogemmata fonticola TaxID=2755323 RepID=A0A7V9AAZ8_9BACT|nr:hypothetical protein [Thermogemmata fonticola]MBA2225666.1 hypothetical protein [Thermogemmata fonticola]